MKIWKLIKVLIFTNISLKIRNADQFVMRAVFEFQIQQELNTPLK